jgi:hypothetical protein
MTARRYVTPWWSHALSAAALLLISAFVFAPKAIEIVNTTGGVGWYAAGAFLSLFLAVNRAVLAFRSRRRQAGEGGDA